MTTHQTSFTKVIGIFLGVVVLILGIGTIGMMFYGANGTRTSDSGMSSSIDGNMLSNPSEIAVPSEFMSKDATGTSIDMMPFFPYPQPGQTSLDQDRKLIKTGFLTIIVNDLRATSTLLSQKAKDLNGFASSSSINTLADGTEQAFITLRVPDKNTDSLLQAIRSNATRVVDEETNSSDTTDQLVDLEARLNSLRQAEAQYSEILKKATSVEDILKITQAQTDIRTQIEQLAAQQQNLQSQVSFSTINVSMSTETGLPGQPAWLPAQQAKLAWQALIRGLQGTADTLIIGLVFLPLLAIWLGLLWLFAKLGYKVIVWIRQRVFRQ
jgi:hypothetical protein